MVRQKTKHKECLCLFYRFQRKQSYLKSSLSKTGFQKSGPHAESMFPGGLQPPHPHPDPLLLQRQEAVRLLAPRPADCPSSGVTRAWVDYLAGWPWGIARLTLLRDEQMSRDRLFGEPILYCFFLRLGGDI